MTNYRSRPPERQINSRMIATELQQLQARRRKGFPWTRLYNGFADDPKWRRVASDAGVRPSDVIATVTKLLEVANVGTPRGSVAEFSPAEWTHSLGVEREVVDKIWSVLEQIGWIDREYVTKWDRWQPDKEDPTHAARQARYRERRRAERGATLPSPIEPCDAVTTVTRTQVPSVPFEASELERKKSPGDTVTTVTMTRRSESDRYSSDEQLPTDATALQDWLWGRGRSGGRGLFLVMDGCERGSELYARDLMADAVRRMGGDSAALGRVIIACRGKARGPAYQTLFRSSVDEQVAIARERASGQAALMLPITGTAGGPKP
jgi:hypothetical protein